MARERWAKFICDRCGYSIVVEDKDADTPLGEWRQIGVGNPFANAIQPYRLICPECVTNLKDWLGEVSGPEVTQSPGEPTPTAVK